jgi:hypothetical protein
MTPQGSVGISNSTTSLRTGAPPPRLGVRDDIPTPAVMAVVRNPSRHRRDLRPLHRCVPDLRSTRARPPMIHLCVPSGSGVATGQRVAGVAYCSQTGLVGAVVSSTWGRSPVTHEVEGSSPVRSTDRTSRPHAFRRLLAGEIARRLDMRPGCLEALVSVAECDVVRGEGGACACRLTDADVSTTKGSVSTGSSTTCSCSTPSGARLRPAPRSSWPSMSSVGRSSSKEAFAHVR